MFTALRKFLVTFLLLLQCVAPLVHAHAGNNTPPNPSQNAANLHIPGLEILVRNDAGSIQLDAVKLKSSEGVIVSVNAGIAQNQDNNSLIDLDCSYFLCQTPLVFTAPVYLCDVNFSPQTALPFVFRWITSSHSQRAPPSLFSPASYKP